VEASPTDEALATEVAAGSHEALQALHHRHAPLVFHLACRSLDRPSAEEVTQDVFLALWTKAASFDASRGSFRPWLLQVAHHRILNELRSRSRRPQADPQAAAQMEDLLGQDSTPEELAWREYRSSSLTRALAALPPAQRQALSLAFFEELSHAEVAEQLQVPLGTAKARIRMGLQKLNLRLAMLAAMGLALLALPAGWSWLRLQRKEAQEDRALQMLTSSHAETLRLEGVGGSPDPESALHATYRGERSRGIAVVTLSRVPPAPAGRHYEIWMQRGGSWRSLGVVAPGADGRDRRIFETPELQSWPEALRLSLERDGAAPVAPGETVAAWPSAK
jgi:RNA polymerase sigma-70 factor (ECF subfamily)